MRLGLAAFHGAPLGTQQFDEPLAVLILVNGGHCIADNSAGMPFRRSWWAILIFPNR